MTRHVSYLSINFYVVNVLNIKWDTLAVSVAPVLTYLRIGRHHSPHWLVVRPALGQVTLTAQSQRGKHYLISAGTDRTELTTNLQSAL